MSRNTGFLVLGMLSLAVVGCGSEADRAGGDSTALANTPGSAPEVDPSFSARRVWEGAQPSFWFSEPSPDGRYLTVVLGSGGLGRMDLLTEEVLAIKPKGTWAESQEWVETTAWSPDGSRVAFVYHSTGYEIRTIGVDGSDERVVVPPAPGHGLYAMLEGWHGDRLLAHYFPPEGDTEYQIVWIDVNDGSIHPILRRPFDEEERLNNAGRQLALSPDGRYVAYAEGRNEGSDVDAVVIRSDDGAEVGRLTAATWDEPLAWTSDGQGLLVYSDRELTKGIWRFPMQDGRPSGDPTLVRGDVWQMTHVGASRDAFYFGVSTDIERVRVASRDPESGALTSEPVALDPVEHSGTPVWSPDGTALAYVRGTSDSERMVVIRSLDGPDVRELDYPIGSLRLASWTDTDKLLGMGKAVSDGDFHAYEIDLASGDIEDLVNLERELPFGANQGHAALSRDGRTIVGRSGGSDSASWRVVEYDLETRQQRTVTEMDDLELVRVFVSPDSRMLALLVRDPGTMATALTLLPAEGGVLREVFRVEAPDGISTSLGSVHWEPGEGGLVFSTAGTDELTERIWRLDYRGVQPTVTQIQGSGWEGVREVAVHPSGTRAAFVVGSNAGEIWMLRERGEGSND